MRYQTDIFSRELIFFSEKKKKNTSLILEYFPNNEMKAFYYNNKTTCKNLTIRYWEQCKIYYISKNVMKFYWPCISG